MFLDSSQSSSANGLSYSDPNQLNKWSLSLVEAVGLSNVVVLLVILIFVVLIYVQQYGLLSWNQLTFGMVGQKSSFYPGYDAGGALRRMVTTDDAYARGKGAEQRDRFIGSKEPPVFASPIIGVDTLRGSKNPLWNPKHDKSQDTFTEATVLAGLRGH